MFDCLLKFTRIRLTRKLRFDFIYEESVVSAFFPQVDQPKSYNIDALYRLITYRFLRILLSRHPESKNIFKIVGDKNLRKISGTNSRARSDTFVWKNQINQIVHP